MPPLMERIIDDYLSAQLQGRHILNQNGANLVYNHACDTANKLGLTNEQKSKIVPFPAPVSLSINTGGQSTESSAAEKSTTTTTADGQPRKSSPIGTLAKYAATAILGGGVGLGGMILHDVLTSTPSTPNSQQSIQIEQNETHQHESQDGRVGFSVES